MVSVQAEKISFSYGKRPILRNVSFAAEQGEILVIAGLSGCGKTTLCHILCGIIPNVIKGTLSGRVSICGEDITRAPLAQIAARVGLVFQDSDNQLLCTTVEDELAFGLENLCRAPEEIRDRVDETLRAFGLEAQRLTDPGALSGGFKRLVAMAAVSIMEPQVLVLDEPMNALDEAGRALVRATVEAQRRAGKTILIVEHDLKLVEYADRWLILRDGGVAALDTPARLLGDKNRLRALELWYG